MKTTERIARCSASAAQDLRAMIRGRVVISDPLIFVIEIAAAVLTSVGQGYLSPVVAMFQAKIIGLAFAAIAVGALVPSAVMSVAFANIVSRNICREFVSQAATGQHTGVAKLAPLVTKAAAVALFILIPLPHLLPFYLLTGLSMLQALPAILLWLCPRAANGRALLVGCVVGLALGSLAAWMVGLKAAISIVSIVGLSVPGASALYALAVKKLDQGGFQMASAIFDVP
jgi:Na+/proline symporter